MDIKLSCSNLITAFNKIQSERNERNSSLGSGVLNSAHCSFFNRHEYYYGRHREWELIKISPGTKNGCRRYNSCKTQTSVLRTCLLVPMCTAEGYRNPITGLDMPWGFQEVEAPRFQDNRHMKVVRLSVLRTGRLYPLGNIPGTHFC